jgi:hypothetical protein
MLGKESLVRLASTQFLRSFVINILVRTSGNSHFATCGENCGEFLLGTIFEYVKRVGIVAGQSDARTQRTAQEGKQKA